MTALASTDVTVTLELRRIEGKRKRNRVKIQFGNATLTYPTGGVPMPSAGAFGMYRNLEGLLFIDEASGNGFVYKYDRTNNKLFIYAETTVATNQPLLEATTALAPAATTIVAEAIGW